MERSSKPTTMSPTLRKEIEDDLRRHEGVVNEIYVCTEGFKTLGVGHLLKKGDVEYDLPIGTQISEEVVERYFKDDLNQAIKDTERLVDDLYNHPDNVVRVLVNMMFNLGITKFAKFKKMLAAVNNQDYATAGDEMRDSKWYGQVGRRSIELVRLMEWCVYG